MRRVQRAQLLALCTAASTSFAVGFLAAVCPEHVALQQPGAPAGVERKLRQQHTARQSPAATIADAAPEAAAEPPTEEPSGQLRSAVFRRTVPFPFEQVFLAWEGGPPDPNFLREDVECCTFVRLKRYGFHCGCACGCRASPVTTSLRKSAWSGRS